MGHGPTPSRSDSEMWMRTMLVSGEVSPFTFENILSMNKFGWTNKFPSKNKMRKDTQTIAVLTTVLFFSKAVNFITKYSDYGKDKDYILMLSVK